MSARFTPEWRTRHPLLAMHIECIVAVAREREEAKTQKSADMKKPQRAAISSGLKEIE